MPRQWSGMYWTGVDWVGVARSHVMFMMISARDWQSEIRVRPLKRIILSLSAFLCLPPALYLLLLCLLFKELRPMKYVNIPRNNYGMANRKHSNRWISSQTVWEAKERESYEGVHTELALADFLSLPCEVPSQHPLSCRRALNELN